MPRAVSGLAGTMMSQLTLATAVVVAAPVPVAEVLVDDGGALAEGLAEAPSAVGLAFSESPSVSAIAAPMTSASANGMPMGTAMRATRRFLRRRRADRLP